MIKTFEGIGAAKSVDEPEPDSRPNRILVAYFYKKGKVLYWQGAGVEAQVEALGEDYLMEYGIDSSPNEGGIFVFEGEFISEKDYWGEYDCYLEGTWRPVTKEEWEYFCNDEYVWEPDPRFHKELDHMELAIDEKSATFVPIKDGGKLELYDTSDDPNWDMENERWEIKEK